MERSIGFYLPVLLTVVGTLAYHVAQKTMPRPVSPFFSLAVAFSIATIVCLIALLSTTRISFALWHDLSWSSVALGFAVVMIETGYLIAYRMGWKLNRTSLFSNVCVAIVLIPIGSVLFREQASLRMMVGSLLCIIGLVLLVR